MSDNSILYDLTLQRGIYPGSWSCGVSARAWTGQANPDAELAEDLREWGFTARGILLPGHCGNTDGLALSTLHDWREKVEVEYRQLKTNTKMSLLSDFPLGALLTLQLALHYPIERIVLMGTPYF